MKKAQKNLSILQTISSLEYNTKIINIIYQIDTNQNMPPNTILYKYNNIIDGCLYQVSIYIRTYEQSTIVLE